jgi:hypothetical protein
MRNCSSTRFKRHDLESQREILLREFASSCRAGPRMRSRVRGFDASGRFQRVIDGRLEVDPALSPSSFPPLCECAKDDAH